MKIGVFETEHFEGAYPVIKSFDNGQNEITIFTYLESYRQFQYLFANQSDKYSWVVKTNKISKYAFIWKILRTAKKHQIQLLYLNTITNNFIFYALLIRLLPKTRVIVTMHDINSYFEYKRSLSLRRTVRYIGKKLLLKVVKEFNVVAMTMVSYLENKLPASKKVHCVPGAVFEENVSRQLQPNIGEHINIVIPGAVDGRRRNYEEALALLHLLEQAKMPATITFLGGFYGDYGELILKKCKAQQLQHIQLKYYEFSTVDQPEFDKVMNEANLVFIPSTISTVIEDDTTEIYGTSISSGNLFDVIKHAKPFIIPEQLKVDPFLEKSCYRYKAIEDIATFIATVNNNAELYTTLQQAALEASRNYTIEKVRERNASLFDVKQG